jgi:hypothetical protein
MDIFWHPPEPNPRPEVKIAKGCIEGWIFSAEYFCIPSDFAAVMVKPQ